MTDLKGRPVDYWKDKLSEEQFRIMRQGGTEAPFTGKLLHNKETGTYICAACGAELFASDTKFDSGTGWPSFYDVKNRANVDLVEDDSGGMIRQEVCCKNCGSHLGHVLMMVQSLQDYATASIPPP